jgi:hypothetical protein
VVRLNKDSITIPTIRILFDDIGKEYVKNIIYILFHEELGVKYRRIGVPLNLFFLFFFSGSLSDASVQETFSAAIASFTLTGTIHSGHHTAEGLSE